MSRDEEVGAMAVRAKKAGGAKAVTEPVYFAIERIGDVRLNYVN